MRYVGIDPGKGGAIACVGSNGALLDVVPMPTTGKGRGSKVDASALSQIIETYSQDEEVTVLVEEVHSMPKQGVASSFDFGRSFGMVEGVASSLGVRLDFVRPQEWKKEFKLNQKPKDTGRVSAIQRWPDKKQHFLRKKDVDKAEAALIAEWGRRNR